MSLEAGMGQALGRADLHVHTRASDGLATEEEMLAYAERETSLDILCIADHDDLSPGLRARDLSLRQGLRCAVVPGMEVTTLHGHLLALFLEEPVPSMRSLSSTIEAVHRQGGVCVVPHPLSWLTYSVGRSQLDALVQGAIPELLPDALEMANPTPAGRVTRRAVRRLNREYYGLAEVGGSDAHFALAVGTGFTLFPGRTPAALKEAILTGTTRAALARRHKRPKLGVSLLARQLFRSFVLHPRKLIMRVVLQTLAEG